MENTLKQVEASFRGLKSCGLVLLLRTKLGERKAGLQDRHPLVLLLKATTNGLSIFLFLKKIQNPSQCHAVHEVQKS